MVDLSGSGENSPLQHSFDNSVFIAPAVIICSLIGLVGYKLFQSLKLKEDKKKLKQDGQHS